MSYAERVESASVLFSRRVKVLAMIDVEIRGSLQIDDGADVQLEGSLTVVEPGDPERIAARAKTGDGG